MDISLQKGMRASEYALNKTKELSGKQKSIVITGNKIIV